MNDHITPKSDDAKPAPFYMKGNYRPVTDEVDIVDLKVTGEIPGDLVGTYMRNGPNPRAGTPGHWFLGDGMLHGLRFENGKAKWYRNRFVRTRQLEGAKFLRDDFSVDYSVAAANTNVMAHAGSIYALVESSLPTRVTRELETLGTHDFGGKLNYAFTAHPKICPTTGEMHAFGYGFAPPFLVYHRIGADGSYLQREEIAVTGPTMVHDFALTRDHVIFMDLPVVFDIEAALRGSMPFQWSDSYPARLAILKRGRPASETRFVSIAPGYAFHVANAYEKADGTIIIDTARYRELWRKGVMRNFDLASLHRWTIAPGASAATETPLDDRAIEFPRINERLTGHSHRIVYAPSSSRPPGIASELSRLTRYDLETGKTIDRNFGDDALMSEFVFVARPNAADEGDGRLMGFVYDGARAASDFFILDAATLDVAARIELPRRVPQGFHGNWIADR